MTRPPWTRAAGRTLAVALEPGELWSEAPAASARWSALIAAADTVKLMAYYENGSRVDAPGPTNSAVSSCCSAASSTFFARHSSNQRDVPLQGIHSAHALGGNVALKKGLSAKEAEELRKMYQERYRQ